MKPYRLSASLFLTLAAAFGRLCVETKHTIDTYSDICAAAFGRLCVETWQLRFFQAA